jgi:hypothetical protein
MIHVFGDSYSEDYRNTYKESISPSYIWKYIDYLGRDVKFYTDLLSEHLNQPITNYSIGGISNEHILMLFMENFSKIKEDDVVVFGWTEITRIMVPIKCDDSYVWRSNLFPNEFLSEQSEYEIRLMGDHDLYRKKLLDTIKFIDEILPNNITIHWTWSTIPHEYSPNITKETNGIIEDRHYGEEGHRILFDKIKEQLHVSKRVRINLWDNIKRN